MSFRPKMSAADDRSKGLKLRDTLRRHPARRAAPEICLVPLQPKHMPRSQNTSHGSLCVPVVAGPEALPDKTSRRLGACFCSHKMGSITFH